MKLSLRTSMLSLFFIKIETFARFEFLVQNISSFGRNNTILKFISEIKNI